MEDNIQNKISNGVNKMKVILKELRETFVCLKIIHRSKLYKTEERIIKAKKENNELIFPKLRDKKY